MLYRLYILTISLIIYKSGKTIDKRLYYDMLFNSDK